MYLSFFFLKRIAERVLKGVAGAVVDQMPLPNACGRLGRVPARRSGRQR